MKEVDNVLVVVYLLLSAYPKASEIRDWYGYTPFYLARRNQADQRITNALSGCSEQRSASAQCQIAPTTSWEDVPTEISGFSGHEDDDLSSIGQDEKPRHRKRRLRAERRRQCHLVPETIAIGLSK
jgi:hypothetical protein